MDKNVHKGHRERLRETVSRVGVDKMQEHQALELLLTYVIPQKDVNPIAHNLIKTFGSFSMVLDADETELVKVKGVGQTTAHFLHTFKDFFALYKQQKASSTSQIKNTAQAVEFIKHYLDEKINEELYAICIDGTNSVKKVEQISKGVSNATSVSIRKITEMAFVSNIHNVIIAHNHPDGKSEPSVQDDKMTKALAMALSINNINLLDHIIIGKNDFYSYNTSGKLQKYNIEMQQLINADGLMQNRCEYND